MKVKLHFVIGHWAVKCYVTAQVLSDWLQIPINDIVFSIAVAYLHFMPYQLSIICYQLREQTRSKMQHFYL